MYEVANRGPEGLEAVAGGATARHIADLASVWADLTLVGMSLHYRSRFTRSADLYLRRALWEQAVVAYGRAIENAKRRGVPDELLTRMAGDAPQVHREILRWRDKHVAHRIDADKEATLVTLVYHEDSPSPTEARVRVELTTGPNDERLADALAELADGLRQRLWHEYLRPLEKRLLDELDDNSGYRRAAKPVDSAWKTYFITLKPSGPTAANPDRAELHHTS